MNGLSFTHFIERYGTAFPPSMRYTDNDDHDRWRADLIETIRDLMGPVAGSRCARL